MRFSVIVIFATLFALANGSTAVPVPPIARGDLLLELTPATPRLRHVARPAGAAWSHDGPDGKLLYRLTVAPGESRQDNLTHIPIDLTPWRGLRVLLSCKTRADNVTKPAAAYNGVKCQIHWISPAKGGRWANATTSLHGTYDWRESSALVQIDDDAGKGYLEIGLQDSAGTVSISEIRITAWQARPLRIIPATPPASPASKGHTEPRLRGVMSPPRFNSQDFADLQKWNANCIRWQLVNRQWGQSGTDRDLDAYDRWLDGKLDELAQTLDAARAHGIKVVIDMHSPPGGRLGDSSLRMVLEKKHQIHFVKIWERIVRRFKAHPALWAYDLINEPVQNQPSPPGVADWREIQILAARAIRAIDPRTTILVTTDQWSSPDAFAHMTPVDIPDVVYQVHMYWPGQYTHQGVNSAWGVQGGEAVLSYPGTLDGQPFDRDALRRHLAPVREFQLAHNVHIYAGEFGAVRWAPGAAQYLDDLILLFEEYDWDWTYHAFREWPGWSVEHADMPYSRTGHPRAETPTERAHVLQKWLALNRRQPDQAKNNNDKHP
jgi:hypothetical protein